MSDDERQHLMDFLLRQQAVFHSEMIDLKARVDKTSENLDKLVLTVQHHADTAEANRQEMREAIDNLIIANEATRELANKAAQLTVNVSQRLTTHERGHN